MPSSSTSISCKRLNSPASLARYLTTYFKKSNSDSRDFTCSAGGCGTFAGRIARCSHCKRASTGCGPRTTVQTRGTVPSRSSTMAQLLALKLASCCSTSSVTMLMALALWTICPSTRLSLFGILVFFVSRGLYLEVGGWDRIRRGCLVRCRIWKRRLWW